MGKIFEALNKSGKQEAFRALDAEVKIERQDVAPAPDPKAAARPASRAAAEPEIKPVPETIAAADPAPRRTVSSAQRQVTPMPLLQEEKTASGVQPEQAAKALVAELPATDRAAAPAAARRVERPASAPKARQRQAKAHSPHDIQINYSQTQVQAVDFEKLRRNKIFSIFDEIEVTDQFKILRTQVLNRLKAIGGNSILVTSANPYEGKTFTSINLGVSIAREFDRTVLIIDADLRKPTKRHTDFATDFFGLDIACGLTDYLKGEAEIPDILINPGINKLTLIPSGEPIENSAELLNSARMGEMMADIKSRYSAERLVIVDGPAMLPFSDAMILTRYVDAVLPVVEVEKTSAEDIKKMMDTLKGIQVLGAVMNKSRDSKSRK